MNRGSRSAFGLKNDIMHDERPSKTAYKVALNILTLGVKPGMAKVLASGIMYDPKSLANFWRHQAGQTPRS